MPLYLVECTQCQTQEDVFLTMEQGGSHDYPVSTCCTSTVRRVYTPQYNKMDSNFTPFWSEMLTREDHPIYIKDKETWRERMADMGVRPWEPDRDRHRRARKELEDTTAQVAEKAVDSAWEQAHESLRGRRDGRSRDGKWT